MTLVSCEFSIMIWIISSKSFGFVIQIFFRVFRFGVWSHFVDSYPLPNNWNTDFTMISDSILWFPRLWIHNSNHLYLWFDPFFLWLLTHWCQALINNNCCIYSYNLISDWKFFCSINLISTLEDQSDLIRFSCKFYFQVVEQCCQIELIFKNLYFFVRFKMQKNEFLSSFDFFCSTSIEKNSIFFFF